MKKHAGLFKEGNPGRPKGSKNKITRDMREIHERILEAIQKKIGVDELVESVDRNNLLQYLARVMPKEVTVKQQEDKPNPIAEEIRKLRETKGK